jgi:hypothetical protein
VRHGDPTIAVPRGFAKAGPSRSLWPRDPSDAPASDNCATPDRSIGPTSNLSCALARILLFWGQKAACPKGSKVFRSDPGGEENRAIKGLAKLRQNNNPTNEVPR